MPTVRTTMRPDQPIEVSDTDYLDLKRQGLLVPETPVPTPVPAARPPAVPKKAAASAISKEG